MTANGSKPEKVAGDTHYGSAENRFQMLLREITLVAPLKEDFNPTGLFPQKEFNLDETGISCLAGNRTMISNLMKEMGRRHSISKKRSVGNVI